MKSLALAPTAAIAAVFASILNADHFDDARAALANIKTHPETFESEDARLDELFDTIWDWKMKEYPTYATMVGYPGQNHRWADSSIEAIEPREKQDIAFLESLEGIDPQKLSEGGRLDWTLVTEDLRQRIQGHTFPDEWLVINQIDGPQQDVSMIINLMPKRTLKHYEDILSRLRGVETLLSNTILFLKKGVETGVTPPRITLRDLPKQFDELLSEDPKATPFWNPFREIPSDISEEDRTRLENEAVEIISGSVQSSFTRLKRYLVDEYIPNSRESISMSDLPDGEAWYAYLANRRTTTILSPQEIHEIGLREVERLYAKILETISETGFEGSFEEFRTFFHQDDQFYHQNAEELVVGYRDICKRADPKLITFFGFLPRLPYAVEPSPDHIAPSAPTAYYLGGSLEAHRPGIFYANTYDMRSRPKWGMEALSLHEAVPGHHLQISIARELGDLHKVRQHLSYTAFVEGWGLYAETLGYDMGFYKDPYSRIGQLTYEIWRAIRLVVDTGIHSLGWSRQDALDYFNKYSLQTEHDIIVEVDRYIVWPGQALAYKIGQMKILELRKKAAQELGDAFDIRAFHDLVLGNGAIPLNVLESRVQDWIDSEKS